MPDCQAVAGSPGTCDEAGNDAERRALYPAANQAAAGGKKRLDPVAYSRPHTLGMEPKTKRLSIGEVARAAGLGVETVRFYEKTALIGMPTRTASGYRQYRPEVVREVQFIKAAKGLGFTLKEIRELLSLRVTKGKACTAVRRRALEKMATVESKLAELRRVRDALSALVAACARSESSSSCALLDALDAQEGSDEG